MLLPTLFCGDFSVNVVEKNPVPKSQTKPFYIGTKEAPSEYYFCFISTMVVYYYYHHFSQLFIINEHVITLCA